MHRSHRPIRRALVLAPVVAGLLAAAGCASTPSPTYTAPAPGSTFVYRVTSTGSFGNGSVETPIRIERAVHDGREVLRWSFPGGATVNDPSSAAIIAALDAQGRPMMRYDPPLGFPWPLSVGKTATQQIGLSVGPRPPVPMTATWSVTKVEDVTVPAGTFRAWRVELVDSFGFRQSNWSVPDALGMFARRESVRPAGHPQGEGTQTMELVSGPRR